MRIILFLFFFCSFSYGQTIVVNRDTRFPSGPVEPISTYSPTVLLLPPTTGDTAWEDTSGNNYDGTIAGTVTLSTDRWTFGGGYFTLPDVTALEFDATTESYTVIIRIRNAPTTGYLASKASGTAANRMFGLFEQSGGTISQMYIGGVTENSAVSVPNDALVIVVVNGGVNAQLYVDGVLGDTGLNGSAIDSGQQWNIGGRTNGSSVVTSGTTMDLFAIIPGALNSTQLADVAAYWQIN